jgi:hypothetical protein
MPKLHQVHGFPCVGSVDIWGGMKMEWGQWWNGTKSYSSVIGGIGTSS